MSGMGEHAKPDWREQRRLDRLAAAQIGRDDEAARAQAHIITADADARRRRERNQARLADRRAALKQRAARRAERMAWLSDHLLDLLFVPVIAVPAVLAWTAMSAFGDQVFGPAGWALPAFSEGAMWAFAAATTITRHHHPGRPVWHLRLGTAVFASVGAALNFIHGMIPAAGQLRGPGVGAVMALVSVAGVVAHQFVTAGPRRSRAERSAARFERARERREHRIRRAALNRAVAEIGADGTARLVVQCATVTMTRKHGRAHLEDVRLPHSLTSSWPRPLPVLSAPGVSPASAPDMTPKMHLVAPPRVHPGSAAQAATGMRHEAGPDAPAAVPPGARKRIRKGSQRGAIEADAARRFASDLAAGQIPSARRIQREMHVGQIRAGELRDQLTDRVHRERGIIPMERKQA
jgi:hypothetical protein